MSTDKTLADVQPGGRVRLGNQAERARFEEFLSRNPLTALCAGTAWEVWKAALSAQPSPGGQGQLDVDDLAQAIRKVDGRHLLGAGALAEAILSELPHLAARQPEVK